MTIPIDTAKVIGRRQLHFDSLDDILADVEGLAKSKDMRTLGNWSAGQVLKHLAILMNKSIDGFVTRPPLVVRVIVRWFFKRRFLTKPMSAGFKLPAEAMAELGAPPTTNLDEGFQSIRHAIKRLKTEPTRAPSAVLGPLTADEWEQLHCRHCELHLSFLVPAD
jgi:Protein of unknown function (DUF1569)